jgi:hypothetical protein
MDLHFGGPAVPTGSPFPSPGEASPATVPVVAPAACATSPSHTHVVPDLSGAAPPHGDPADYAPWSPFPHSRGVSPANVSVSFPAAIGQHSVTSREGSVVPGTETDFHIPHFTPPDTAAYGGMIPTPMAAHCDSSLPNALRPDVLGCTPDPSPPSSPPSIRSAPPHPQPCCSGGPGSSPPQLLRGHSPSNSSFSPALPCGSAYGALPEDAPDPPSVPLVPDPPPVPLDLSQQ